MTIIAFIVLIVAILLLMEGSADAAKLGLIFMTGAIFLFAFAVNWSSLLASMPAIAEWIFQKVFVVCGLIVFGPIFFIKLFLFKGKGN